MSKQRAALEACLARFELLEDQPHVRGTDDCYEDIIAEIRAALAEQDAEPVAWLTPTGNIMLHDPTETEKYHGMERSRPLYTHPPRREWVGLTEGEMLILANNAAPPDHMIWVHNPDQAVVAIARAIEVEVRERNT